MPDASSQPGTEGRPEVVVDLDAVTANAAALLAHVRGAQLMAVVKSDGYGHGLVPTATAAVAGGASWLGVVQIADALALRAAGFTVPVVCLLAAPDARHEEAVAAGIDLTVGTAAVAAQVAAAARRAGRTARLHLEADTGMSRCGATVADWPGLVAAALDADLPHERRQGAPPHHAARTRPYLPEHPAVRRDDGTGERGCRAGCTSQDERRRGPAATAEAWS